MHSAADNYQKGQILLQNGQAPAALDLAQKALKAHPGQPFLLLLAGLAAQQMGEQAQALKYLTLACKRAPQNTGFWQNLAQQQWHMGDTAAAQQSAQTWQSLQPQHPAAAALLAECAQAQQNWRQALQHWQHAAALAPQQAEYISNAALLARRLCDWSQPLPPWSDLTPGACVQLGAPPTIARQQAERYMAQLFPKIPPAPAQKPSAGKIKIAYLSADWHEHATAYLMAELFELHNHTLFDVTVLSLGPDDGSAIRARIKNNSHFIDLAGLPLPAQIARVRDLAPDIIIDLKGHTKGQNWPLLAARLAPIQIHWLGFPGSLGAPFIDYLVGDAIVTPTGHEHYYQEKILRLPCYQINDRKRPRPTAAPNRAEYSLPEQAIVLASFNQPTKLTPEIFALWLKLLAQNPQTVLWQYAPLKATQENLIAATAAQGIDSQRLIFADNAPLETHLSRYLLADLVLDSFPYTGHTTCSDALWMGAPIVTLAGDNFASLVAASLLQRAGLPHYITHNTNDYMGLMTKLIQNRQSREQARAKFAQAWQSPLFDTPRLVQDWENALQHTYAEHKAKQQLAQTGQAVL